MKRFFIAAAMGLVLSGAAAADDKAGAKASTGEITPAASAQCDKLTGAQKVDCLKREASEHNAQGGTSSSASGRAGAAASSQSKDSSSGASTSKSY